MHAIPMLKLMEKESGISHEEDGTPGNPKFCNAGFTNDANIENKVKFVMKSRKHR